MSVTVRQLAELVKGQVEVDGDLVIQAARPLHEAQPGHITFLDQERHLAKLQASRASAVVANDHMSITGKTVIRAADPLAAFAAIAQRLHGRPAPAPSGLDPRAAVDPSVRLGAEPRVAAVASIGAGTVIG